MPFFHALYRWILGRNPFNKRFTYFLFWSQFNDFCLFIVSNQHHSNNFMFFPLVRFFVFLWIGCVFFSFFWFIQFKLCFCYIFIKSSQFFHDTNVTHVKVILLAEKGWSITSAQVIYKSYSLSSTPEIWNQQQVKLIQLLSFRY